VYECVLNIYSIITNLGKFSAETDFMHTRTNHASICIAVFKSWIVVGLIVLIEKFGRVSPHHY